VCSITHLRYVILPGKGRGYSFLQNRPYQPRGPSSILFSGNRGWV